MSRRIRLRTRRPAGLWRDNRTTTLLEFALVGPLFLTFLLLIFEVAYDQFLQEVLEATLDYTSHEAAVGNYQGATSGATFVTNDFCSNDLGLLNCGSVYVRVQEYLPSAACNDLYGETTGMLPVSSGGSHWLLQLNNFISPGGAGSGNAGATPAGDACISTNSKTGFCNSGPGELIIMSAIYVAPSFVTALLPGAYTVTYNGRFVRAPFASVAFQTEPYTAATPSVGPQC